MKVEKVNYLGNSVRYAVVSENGILLNTDDICRCLNITDKSPQGVLSQSCMNIVGVIEAAMTGGRSEMDFVRWLENNFIGYEMQTSIYANCDGNWE